MRLRHHVAPPTKGWRVGASFQLHGKTDHTANATGNEIPAQVATQRYRAIAPKERSIEIEEASKPRKPRGSTSVFWQFPWHLFGLVGLATSSQAQTRPEMQILPSSQIAEWCPINTRHHALTSQYLPRQIEACLVLRKRIILQQNPRLVKFRTWVATLWSCRLSGPFSAFFGLVWAYHQKSDGSGYSKILYGRTSKHCGLRVNWLFTVNTPCNPRSWASVYSPGYWHAT